MEIDLQAAKESALKKKMGKARAKLRASRAMRGMLLFVFLPTLIATLYYYLIAADVYVVKSEYAVNVEGSTMQGGAGALGMLMPAMANSSNTHEAMIVRQYISSPAIIDKLEKSVGLRGIFDHPKADRYSRIPADLSREKFLGEYQRMVEVMLDEPSGISTLVVRAFTAEDAAKLANGILDETEDFVNKMANRMRNDSIAFAKEELKNTENEVVAANLALANFRNTNKSFDPSMTAASILGITSNLEEDLAKTNAEIANLRNFMKSDNPKISSLEAKAAALREQIDAQSGRLANNTGSKLADITQDYESLIQKREFALKKYEMAFSSYEAAQAEARKKSKYLLRIVEPTQPQTAIEPNRLKKILTVFLSCLIGYTLGVLILAAIKDHIRP